jgi:hypothetical protein
MCLSYYSRLCKSTSAANSTWYTFYHLKPYQTRVSLLSLCKAQQTRVSLLSIQGLANLCHTLDYFKVYQQIITSTVSRLSKSVSAITSACHAFYRCKAQQTSTAANLGCYAFYCLKAQQIVSVVTLNVLCLLLPQSSANQHLKVAIRYQQLEVLRIQ